MITPNLWDAAKTVLRWRLNNTLLKNQEITKEIKEEIKKYLETNDNEDRKSTRLNSSH